MEWLNYHHLLYAWTVAREGSVAKAAGVLRLRPPTVSAQVRILEDRLGARLFDRKGRRLEPTETGRIVLEYAGEIFRLGGELLDVVKGRPAAGRARLAVGVADVVPKEVAYRLLEPALRLPDPVRLVCREDRHERLLAMLAVHEVEVVITDTPIGGESGLRAYNHLLGECGVSVFAPRRAAPRLRRGFPRSLDRAKFLLPSHGTALRRSLEQWFDAAGIAVQVAGEFDDSALLKVFGREEGGLFAAPSVLEREIARQHGVSVVGRVPSIRERFYLISAERRLRNPAVTALTEEARSRLFA